MTTKRLAYDEWKANFDTDLSQWTKTFKGKGNGKFNAIYVPANTMLTILKGKYPEAYPELVKMEPLGEGLGVLLHVALNWGDGTQSPTLIYPVMSHGAGRHAAVSEPDARDVSDSMNRAFAKLISLETGLCWSIWVDVEPDAEDEKPPKEEKTRRRGRSTPAKEEEEEEDFDYDNDEEDEEEDEEEEEEEAPPKKRAARNTFSRRRRSR